MSCVRAVSQDDEAKSLLVTRVHENIAARQDAGELARILLVVEQRDVWCDSAAA